MVIIVVIMMIIIIVIVMVIIIVIAMVIIILIVIVMVNITSLGVQVVQVVHHELVAGREVSPVELVGDVPADGTVLPPLLHDGVEEGHGVQHGRPGGVVGVVQVVLGDVSVGSLHTRSDPLRWLVGELQGHLQQADGELLVDLRGDPQPEGGVDVVGVQHGLHDLVTEVKREMAVL